MNTTRSPRLGNTIIERRMFLVEATETVEPAVGFYGSIETGCALKRNIVWSSSRVHRPANPREKFQHPVTTDQ